jgi:hypothetical protein
LEHDHNYQIGADGLRYQLIRLADTTDKHVVDGKAHGSWHVDQVARGRLEEMVFGVKPSGSSLFPASDEVPRREVEIRNHQTWVGHAVKALMGATFMD